MIRALRYSVRAARANGVAAGAVAVLTGFTTALIVGSVGIWRALVLAPVPFGHPDAVFSVHTGAPGASSLVSPGVFVAWSSTVRGIDLAAIRSSRTSNFSRMNLLDSGPVEQLYGAEVTPNLFELLQAQPAIGRTLVPRDDGTAVVVLSNELWHRRFGADEHVVGRTIHLVGFSDRWYRIVGVMRPGFRVLYDFSDRSNRIARDEEFWTVLNIAPQERSDYAQAWAQVVGRLVGGASKLKAEGELTAIAQSVTGGQREARTRVRLDSVSAEASRAVRPRIVPFVLAVALVSVAALVGFANLTLVRAMRARQQFAIRMALGADTRRLWNLCIADLLIAISPGTLVGTFVGWATLAEMMAFIPTGIAQGRTGRFGIDGFVIVILAALTAFVATGAAAYWFYVPRGRRILIDAASRGETISRIARAGQRVVLLLQLALAVTFVVGAALLTESFWNMSHIDMGFDADEVIVASTTMPRSRAPSDDVRRALVGNLLRISRDLPGIRAAGITTSLPLRGPNVTGGVAVPGNRRLSGRAAALRSVSGGYFEAMRIPLERGRYFSSEDLADGGQVAIVSASFVHAFIRTGNALGTTVACCNTESPRTIVGVVADVAGQSLSAAPTPTVYVPYDQWPLPRIAVVARVDDVRVDSAALLHELRTADGALAWEPELMTKIVSAYLSGSRFSAVIFVTLCTLALLISVVSTVGVVSRTVSDKLQELAIRSAFGASTRHLVSWLLRRLTAVLASAICVGIAASLWLVSILESALYHTAAFHVAWTIVGSVVGVTVITLCAAYFPIRQGLRADIRTLLVD